MITCPRCGFQAPDGTPWCPRCGYGKPQQPPIPQPIPPAQQPPNQRPDPDAPVSIASDEGRKIILQAAVEKQQAVLDQKQKEIYILGIIIGILFAVLLILNSIRANTKKQFRAAQQTADAQRAEIRSLRQTIEAVPTAVPTEIPTEIPPAADESLPEIAGRDPFATDYGQYCGTMLTVWQYSAGLDNVSGSLQQSDFDTDQNACRYILTGTNTGSMTLYLDPADDVPYRAIFEIDGTYPSDRDIMIDWAAHVGSYLDFAAPATAKRHINEAMDAGTGTLGNQYKITVDRSEDPVIKLVFAK